MNRHAKSISYGDKIFARVTRNGQTILNFVTEQVSTMSELIGELRKAMKDFSGLVILHIRNYNRGWGEDRPLLLYSTGKARENRMLFPWETH